MAKGPRLSLVHGGVVNGEVTWAALRPLAARFDRVIPNRRGFDLVGARQPQRLGEPFNERLAAFVMKQNAP